VDPEPATDTPFDTAKIYHLIDDQRESVGNANRAFDFEASTGFRNIADNAIDLVCTAERDRARLQGAPA